MDSRYCGSCINVGKRCSVGIVVVEIRNAFLAVVRKMTFTPIAKNICTRFFAVVRHTTFGDEYRIGRFYIASNIFGLNPSAMTVHEPSCGKPGA